MPLDDMALPQEGRDYWIRYMEMPPGIYAFVISNGDGTYTIVLDPRRSREQQIDDYVHELWHIINDDLYNGTPIQFAENRAEALTRGG